MPLDGLSVHALRLELSQQLTNARVLKIFQPWPDTIIMHLRTGNDTRRLLLSASPLHPSAHLTRLQPENPLQAPIFSMVLRKHLEPARLLRIEQIGLDRILRFEFETFEEHGQRAVRVLVAELTGRSSNLVLIDPSEERVIDALRRHHAGGAARTVSPGALYEPPVARAGEKQHPFEETRDGLLRYLRLAPAPKTMAKLLMDRYDGFGPFAAKEAVLRAGLAPEITRGELSLSDLETVTGAILKFLSRLRAGQFEPTVFKGADGLDSWILSPYAPNVRQVQTGLTMCEAADRAFATQHQRMRLERVQGELLRHVRRSHKRAERKLSERRREQSAALEADHFRHYGDLLSANLHRVEPRSESVEVPDYENDYIPIRIQLDPLITPVQNVQAYYHKYQRAKRAAAELERLTVEASMEAEYLAQVMTDIELAESEAELEEIAGELMQQGVVPKRTETSRKRHKTPPSKPLRFASSEGHAIWVGRNNRQNDQLTMRTAGPDDLWFHTKEIPGSHVILRVDKEPSERAIEEAAILAAYYSKARESSNVPVDFVAKRHVRKPSGAPPGFVIYDHHQTLYVTPDAELVERLRLEIVQE